MIETDIRTYYLPLRAYTYNDVYAPARHGYRRIILLPQFKKYKKFCKKWYSVYDAIVDGHTGDKTEYITPWFSNKYLYNVKCWFGFPRDDIVTGKQIGRSHV